MSEVMITAWKALNYKDLVTRVAPIHWDIDLTMICNHRCQGCFYIGLPEDGFDSGQEVFRNMKTGSLLDTKLVLDTLHAIPKVGGKAITFVGGGEPTLHPDIIKVLKTTKDVGLKFGLISHLGLKYRDEFFQALLSATWVRASVNAAKNETYRKIQGIKNKEEFNRVVSNITTFAELGGNIGVSFLIHPDTYQEIADAAKLFSGIGAKYIQYKPYITDKKMDLYAGLEDKISDLLEEAKIYATSNFQVVDQFLARKQMLLDYWNKKACGQCWVARFNPKITANGKLYVCCELAYSDNGLIGDLTKTSLEDMIASGAWQKVESEIDTNKCPPCWERSLNKAINDGSFHSMKPPIQTLDAEFI